jgi:hypothetical protein
LREAARRGAPSENIRAWPGAAPGRREPRETRRSMTMAWSIRGDEVPGCPPARRGESQRRLTIIQATREEKRARSEDVGPPSAGYGTQRHTAPPRHTVHTPSLLLPDAVADASRTGLAPGRWRAPGSPPWIRRRLILLVAANLPWCSEGRQDRTLGSHSDQREAREPCVRPPLAAWPVVRGRHEVVWGVVRGLFG